MKAKSWKSFVPKPTPEEAAAKQQEDGVMDSLRTLFQSGENGVKENDKAQLQSLLGEDSELLNLMAERERLERQMQEAAGGGVPKEHDPRYNSNEVPSIETVKKREKADEAKRQKSVQHFIEKRKEQQAWLSNREASLEKLKEKRKEEAELETRFSSSADEVEPEFSSDKKFYEFDGLDRPRKHKKSLDSPDLPPLKTREEIKIEQSKKKNDDWYASRDFYSDEFKGSKKVKQKLKHKDKVEAPLTFSSDKKLEEKTSTDAKFREPDDLMRRKSKSKNDFDDSQPRFSSDRKLDVEPELRSKRRKASDSELRSVRVGAEDKELTFASDRRLKSKDPLASPSLNLDGKKRKKPRSRNVDDFESRRARSKTSSDSEELRPDKKRNDPFNDLDARRSKSSKKSTEDLNKRSKDSGVDEFKRKAKKSDPFADLDARRKKTLSNKNDTYKRQSERKPDWEARREMLLQLRSQRKAEAERWQKREAKPSTDQPKKTQSRRTEARKQEQIWEEKRQRLKEERRLNKKDRFS